MLAEQARLCELAVFPEDVQVPVAHRGATVARDRAASTRSTPTSCCSASTDSRCCCSSTSTAASSSSTTSSAPGCATGWAQRSCRGRAVPCDGYRIRLRRRVAPSRRRLRPDPPADASARRGWRAWRRLLLDPRWMARKLAPDGPGLASLIDDYRDADGISASSAMPCVCRRTCSAATRRNWRASSAAALVAAKQRPYRLGHRGASQRTERQPASRDGRLMHPAVRCFAPSTDMQIGRRRGAAAGRPPRPLRLQGQTLKLWDLETGAVLRTFEGHAGPVTDVALLPDGRRALSAFS